MAKKAPAASAIIPAERIERCIYLIRGQKVVLDQDLAGLYGVQTRVLNQAVTRNMDRFPEDFAFRLTPDEFENLKSQIVTSSWGGRRKPPQGVYGAGCGHAVQRSEECTSHQREHCHYENIRQTQRDNGRQCSSQPENRTAR